jgi:hypothetical protein
MKVMPDGVWLARGIFGNMTCRWLYPRQADAESDRTRDARCGIGPPWRMPTRVPATRCDGAGDGAPTRCEPPAIGPESAELPESLRRNAFAPPRPAARLPGTSLITHFNYRRQLVESQGLRRLKILTNHFYLMRQLVDIKII